jgi:hypothetical protein
VGGYFGSVGGGIEASSIAAWNGQEWRPLGYGICFPGCYESVWSLAATGAALVAGGTFSIAGAEPANRVAIWNGLEWNPLGSGTNHSVCAVTFAEHDLYVGGWFSQAGTVASRHIGLWTGHTAAVPESDRKPAAASIHLLRAPNPYAPGQTIWLTAQTHGAVRATILDASGRVVRSLAPVWAGRDRASIVWDGQTETGIRAAAGVYYLQAQVGSASEGRRIVLLR